MADRPILFSAPMVQAILDGSKTQTRRVVKRLNVRDAMPDPEYQSLLKCCPHGTVGSRLWVRETWRIGAWDEENCEFAIDYCDGPRKKWRSIPDDDDGEKFSVLWVACCDELLRKGIEPGYDGMYRWSPGESPLRWRPSIHMPRWASRITLEITDVRVERLQDISEEDAIAEGVFRKVGDCPLGNVVATALGEEAIYLSRGQARMSFMELWQSINGPGSWDANPCVWVIEFRRVKP